jgi:hypothetical protein
MNFQQIILIYNLEASENYKQGSNVDSSLENA